MRSEGHTVYIRNLKVYINFLAASNSLYNFRYTSLFLLQSVFWVYKQVFLNWDTLKRCSSAALRCFSQGSLSELQQRRRAQLSARLAAPALLILPGPFQHCFITAAVLSSERIGVAEGCSAKRSRTLKKRNLVLQGYLLWLFRCLSEALYDTDFSFPNHTWYNFRLK